MLESVRDLMGMENAEASNVKSWMQTLSSLSSADYLVLSEDSKILMSALAIDILRASVGLGLSIEDLREAGLGSVMGICVSGLSSSLESGSSDPRFSLLMSLLSESSDFLISDMLNDQSPMTSVTPYLRSSSFFLGSSPTSLTPYDSLGILGKPQPTFYLSSPKHRTSSPAHNLRDSGCHFICLPIFFAFESFSQTWP
jgi:hypothetical protein